MENQQDASTPRRKKVFYLVAIIAAGLALGTVMRTFVCGKTCESCSC